jgi:leucyl aminopeptidase (aminopeptidase T)
MDPNLLDRVAERVLRESLRVRAGEAVTIETWNTGLAFAQRAAVQARRMGAIPVLLFEDEATFIEGLRRTPGDHLGKMGKHEYALLSKTNAYVFIPGPVLGGSPKLSREEFTASTTYNSSWYAAAKKAGLRGVRLTLGYVGPELAKILRKPVGQIVEHQLRASLTDLRKVRRTGIRLSGRLRPRARATLSTEGETLHFELGAEEALDDGAVSRNDVASGGNLTNVPPGYYAREIVASSLQGTVRMYAPVPRIGTVADLRLEFRRGRLVRWRSEANPRWLNRLVQMTPKDRRTLGAVAIGLNPDLRGGYGQDRLREGAITFFGMFQGTTHAADLEVDGRPVVTESSLMPSSSRG